MLTYELKYLKGIMCLHSMSNRCKNYCYCDLYDLSIWKVIEIYVACFVISFYSLNLLDTKTN